MGQQEKGHALCCSLTSGLDKPSLSSLIVFVYALVLGPLPSLAPPLDDSLISRIVIACIILGIRSFARASAWLLGFYCCRLLWFAFRVGCI
jgi:hypothetical protein